MLRFALGRPRCLMAGPNQNRLVLVQIVLYYGASRHLFRTRAQQYCLINSPPSSSDCCSRLKSFILTIATNDCLAKRKSLIILGAHDRSRCEDPFFLGTSLEGRDQCPVIPESSRFLYPRSSQRYWWQQCSSGNPQRPNSGIKWKKSEAKKYSFT